MCWFGVGADAGVQRMTPSDRRGDWYSGCVPSSVLGEILDFMGLKRVTICFFGESLACFRRLRELIYSWTLFHHDVWSWCSMIVSFRWWCSFWLQLINHWLIDYCDVPLQIHCCVLVVGLVCAWRMCELMLSVSHVSGLGVRIEDAHLYSFLTLQYGLRQEDLDDEQGPTVIRIDWSNTYKFRGMWNICGYVSSSPVLLCHCVQTHLKWCCVCVFVLNWSSLRSVHCMSQGWKYLHFSRRGGSLQRVWVYWDSSAICWLWWCSLLQSSACHCRATSYAAFVEWTSPKFHQDENL